MSFDYKYGMYSYIWETFNTNKTRTFVCEKGRNSSEQFEKCLVFSEVSNDITDIKNQETAVTNDTLTFTLVAVISFVLVVLICALVVFMLYKRKLAVKVQYEQQYNSSTKEQVNFMYMNSDDILIIQKKPSKINSENHSTKQATGEREHTEELDSNEIYVNEKHVILRSRPESTKNMNDKVEIPEEDYDHLNRNNNDVTLVQEDTYSHMTDDQYGIQQIQCEDTYDHTGATEDEYGAARIDQDVNNMYDHTGINDTDDVYSLPNKGTCHTETVYNIVKKTHGTD
ncbi:uncharacterized protein LOC134236791 [Saccostrea cucullata]|uniref:uncharacterized protein LOC134236791 n=1 Tax=Saccostrea cuccullata TaxID=36930 RepID=UPI002ED01954